MSYRDQLAAARALAAKLERELLERSPSIGTLRKYRNALFLESAKLRHALIWYENGEQYGFNRFEKKDDLSPTQRDPAPLPGIEQLDRAMAGLDEQAIRERTRTLTGALDRRDPKVAWLEQEIERLRGEIAEMRPRVEAYAAKYPDHPPPPEYNPLPVLVVGGVAVLAMILGLVSLF